MSGWRENIERVREGRDPGHPTVFDDDLDALTAQIEELELERDGFDESNKALYEHLALAKNRAEAAEQRVKELEEQIVA